MIKLEVSGGEGLDNKKSAIKAKGKTIDLILETAVAVASLLEMVEENCKEEFPIVTDFVVMEAQKIAKTKEHRIKPPSKEEKTSLFADNPSKELLREILNDRFWGG